MSNDREKQTGTPHGEQSEQRDENARTRVSDLPANTVAAEQSEQVKGGRPKNIYLTDR
jgi:hypothetical protein